MPVDAQLQMLTEYLTGEEGGEDDQLSAAKISRLIIAGNSLAPGALAERIEAPSYAERKVVRNSLSECEPPSHILIEEEGAGSHDLYIKPHL